MKNRERYLIFNIDVWVRNKWRCVLKQDNNPKYKAKIFLPWPDFKRDVQLGVKDIHSFMHAFTDSSSYTGHILYTLVKSTTLTHIHAWGNLESPV